MGDGPVPGKGSIMHRIVLSDSELSTVRYALDQHIITLRELIDKLPEGSPARESLAREFKTYITNMQALLDKLPEV